MPIPAYMWLKDDGGAAIRGSVTVQEREGSIEVVGFSHGLNLPVDSRSGQIVGTRLHAPMCIEKEFDASSPYFYKAVATGQTLRSAELKWYKINDAGQEQVYFIMLLEGVKIAGINPGMTNAKLAEMSAPNHIESISIMYERITWHYTDGNVKYTDSWDNR